MVGSEVIACSDNAASNIATFRVPTQGFCHSALYVLRMVLGQLAAPPFSVALLHLTGI